MRTRLADRGDLDGAADVLGESFADDAWTHWTVEESDHLRRVTALQRLALEHYGLAHGEVWLTELDGAIECVAVWTDSAIDLPSSEAVTAAAATHEGIRHPFSQAADAQIAAFRPTDRHLYLGAVGTRSRARRRGLASATLAPVLARADADRVGAFLETSSAENVAFYQALGFEVSDHCVIDGGGPDVWAMWRQPAG